MAIQGLSYDGLSQSYHNLANATANQQASLGSINISVVDAQSALLDSAEEMGFAYDNSKKSKLADRKQKDAGLQIKQRLQKLMQIVKTQAQADMDARKNLLSKWQEQKSNFETIKQDLEKQGGFSFLNYLSLLDMLDNCEDSDLCAQLQKAAQSIYTQHESSIIAACNAANAATDFSFADEFNLSCDYVAVCFDFKDSLAIMDYLKNKYGQDKIALGLEFLLKALACDLNSVKQSYEHSVLQSLGSSLTRAKELNGALAIIDNFTQRLKRQHLLDINKLDNFSLLENILKLSSLRFINTLAVRNLYAPIAKQDEQTEVLIAQDLLQTIRSLNIDIFASLEERMHLVEAVQKHVDECIEREDEYLANM